jgi:hypothetical protein
MIEVAKTDVWSHLTKLYGALPQLQLMSHARTREPLSHSKWFFGVKWEGVRSLAYVPRSLLGFHGVRASPQISNREQY